ncbi:MAG: hypothetical protein ACE5FG_16105 [Myxococcota bacterium]
MTESTSSELAIVEEPTASIVRVASIDGAVDALQEYRTLQKRLDEAMPECRVKIRSKWFRKKDYWRAIKTAFNLSVELVSEARFSTDDGEDWGYSIVYRATAPNGAACCGDGACQASEKRTGQDTVHNVRAHAHTRAVNRAISNLVGFGEVSAEEMQFERGEPRDVTPPRESKPRPRTITDKQRKMLFAKAAARAEDVGLGGKRPAEDILRAVLADMGWESTSEIPMDAMDNVIHAIEVWEIPPPESDAGEPF